MVLCGDSPGGREAVSARTEAETLSGLFGWQPKNIDCVIVELIFFMRAALVANPEKQPSGVNGFLDLRYAIIAVDFLYLS